MSELSSDEPIAPEFVIITGLSGSGKGTVLRVFEDLGHYAVDNLPVELIPKFIELCRGSEEIRRAALVVDVREPSGLERFPEVLEELKAETSVLLIFLKADEDVLQRRFSETRRPHPFSGEGTVLEKIRSEIERMAPLESLADLTIDTSKCNIHELRRLIVERFGESDRKSSLLVTVESFGFKHGVPIDSDLVFDVRFLPNPHYLPGGKDLTGLDQKVVDYVNSFPQTQEFIARTADLLLYLMPHYGVEGKSYLTISIGCTGGRHRSVMIAERLAARLTAADYTAKIFHRDIHKGQ